MPNLLFAAVHHLLLSGTEHGLAEFYPSITGDAHRGDPYPSFCSFCLEYRAKIAELLKTRRVQTNEVRRSALLLPAFGIVAQRTEKPLALIELGTSAGLNLLLDRYGYDYGGRRVGDPSSPVWIYCEPRGTPPPPLPEAMPEVVSRRGIDLHPVDIEDPEEVRWLEALIWPEQFRERAELLRYAVEIASEEQPSVIRGDAAEKLPELLENVPEDATPCVFHTFTLKQLPEEGRRRIPSTLREYGADGELFRVSVEWEPGEWPLLRLTYLVRGREEDEVLARCDAHGEWMEWLDG